MKNNKGSAGIWILVFIIILIIAGILLYKFGFIFNDSNDKSIINNLNVVRDSIKTEVDSSIITNTNFEKDYEGCYYFDFDNKNNNANIVNIRGKDKIGGNIKLCGNDFTNDNLTWEGKSPNNN